MNRQSKQLTKTVYKSSICKCGLNFCFTQYIAKKKCFIVLKNAHYCNYSHYVHYVSTM